MLLYACVLLTAMVLGASSNDAHKALPTSLFKDENDPLVTEFTNLIQKHVDEIKNFRLLHPDVNDNNQLSSKFNEIFQNHIKSTINNHGKESNENEREEPDGIAEVNKDVAGIIQTFRNLIQKHANEIRRFRSLHPSVNNNPGLSRRINQIIQDHIQSVVRSHIKEKIKEIVHLAKSSNARIHNELANVGSVNVHQHEQHKENERKQQEQHHSNSRYENRQNNEHDRRNDRHNNENTKDRVERQSHVENIHGLLKELKTNINTKIAAKKAAIASKISEKLDTVKEIIQHKHSTKNNNINTNKIHTLFSNIKSNAINGVKENREDDSASYLAKLQSAKEDLDKSKQEFVSASIKLHPHSSNTEGAKGHNDKSSNIGSLETVKSNLREFILKKAQVIKDEIAYNKLLNQVPTAQALKLTSSAALNQETQQANLDSQLANQKAQEANYNSQLANQKTQEANYNSQLANQKTQEANYNSQLLNKQTQEANYNSQNAFASSSAVSEDEVQSGTSTEDSAASEQKLMRASGNDRGNDNSDNDQESSAVVLSLVFSGLVLSAFVGVLIAVLWKRHSRHRLYSRIPGGNLVKAPEKYTM